MLKMNLFMFTATISVKKRERSVREYEHQKRIKEQYDGVQRKNLEHSHWLYLKGIF